jgi:hypothetical protein
MPYILGKLFLGEEWIGPTYCMICICMCMIELNFEKQIENKLEVNSNWKTVTRNVTQLQLAITSLFEIKILSFTTVRKVTKLCRM